MRLPGEQQTLLLLSNSRLTWDHEVLTCSFPSVSTRPTTKVVRDLNRQKTVHLSKP